MSIDRFTAFNQQIAWKGRRGEPWSSEAAGLVTLRLLEGVLSGASADAWGFEKTRSVLGELEESNPYRGALEAIVAAAVGKGHNQHASALIAYARILEDHAEWSLALDVYRTALRSMSSLACREAAHCCYRMGYCYFCLELPQWSAKAFRRSRSLALRANDAEGALRPLQGLVRLQIRRGDLPGAERRITRVLRIARKRGLRDVEVGALQVLGEVKASMGHYDQELPLLNEALALCTNARSRFRLQADSGHCHYQLGQLERARTIFASVARHSPEAFVRAAAYVNLMDIASLSNDVGEVIRLEACFLLERPTPRLLAAGREILGDLALQHRDFTQAKRHFIEAHAIAIELGYNQLAFQLEAKLAIARSATSSSHRERSEPGQRQLNDLLVPWPP